VTIFSHVTTDLSVFVKCNTIFRLLSWKVPQIRTSAFRKVVRKYTEGILLYIYIRCYIMKVIAMSLVYYYLGHNVGDISGHHCRRGN